jgi:hypothetical protein
MSEYEFNDDEFENEYNIEDRVDFLNQKKVQDPTESFIGQVMSIIKILMETISNFNILEQDKLQMNLMLKRINFVSYKNPTAFIFGFLASKGGQDKDLKDINKYFTMIKFLPKTVNQITKFDIIKYSQLCLKS